MKKPLSFGVRGICSPCMGCEKRSIDCHADCAKYKAWRAEKDVLKQQKADTMPHAAEQYRRECRAKAAKYWNKRRRKNHEYFKIGRR